MSYELYVGYHQKGDFLEFFLFVRGKRHERVRSAFFQIKSWCRKTLHT